MKDRNKEGRDKKGKEIKLQNFKKKRSYRKWKTK